MNEPLYSLKAVCKLTGLRAATLHAWEKRYGAVTPQRMNNRHRVYTFADVEKLCLLVAAKDLGHPIGKVAHLSPGQLKSMIDLRQPAENLRHSPSKKSRPGSSSAFCRRTLHALGAYDLERVQEELQTARDRYDTATFILDILVPLFSHMKKLGLNEPLTVPQEHAISAMIRASLMAEDLRWNRGQKRLKGPIQKRIKRVVLTTMDGDYHEFGILLAAVLCNEQGLCVSYLGPSIPPQPLAEAVHALRSDILILSCPKISHKLLPRSPQEYIQTLISHMPRLCEIWLGGDDASFLSHVSGSHKIVHIKTLHELYKKITKK